MISSFQDSSCTHRTQGRPGRVLKKPSFHPLGGLTLVGVWTRSPVWGAALIQAAALVPNLSPEVAVARLSQHLYEEVTVPVPLVLGSQGTSALLR